MIVIFQRAGVRRWGGGAVSPVKSYLKKWIQQGWFPHDSPHCELLLQVFFKVHTLFPLPILR